MVRRHLALSAVSVLLASLSLGAFACGSSDAPGQPQAPPPAAPPVAPAPAETAAPAPSAEASGAATTAPAADNPLDRKPDVVYVPTPQPVVDRMLTMAKIKKTDVVYDLGCGDGRIVVTAAKKYGVKAFGYDIDPKRVEEAIANVKKAGVENLVTIERKDIFTLDLSPASVVTLYLLPSLNVKLVPQLEKLKPGSRVITHDFDIEGFKPDTRVAMNGIADDHGGSADHAIYFFTMPLKPVKK